MTRLAADGTNATFPAPGFSLTSPPPTLSNTMQVLRVTPVWTS